MAFYKTKYDGTMHAEPALSDDVAKAGGYTEISEAEYTKRNKALESESAKQIASYVEAKKKRRAARAERDAAIDKLLASA